LAGQVQENGRHLLHLDRCQGERFPFRGRPLLHPFDLSYLCRETTLVQNDHRGTIEEAVPGPGEASGESIFCVGDLDAPERLSHEVLDPEVAVNDKAEGWKLA
jgi:hypothetical protein